MEKEKKYWDVNFSPVSLAFFMIALISSQYSIGQFSTYTFNQIQIDCGADHPRYLKVTLCNWMSQVAKNNNFHSHLVVVNQNYKNNWHLIERLPLKLLKKIKERRIWNKLSIPLHIPRTYNTIHKLLPDSVSITYFTYYIVFSLKISFLLRGLLT